MAPAAGLSLGDLFPELVPEWDIAANNGLTAFDVRYGSTAPRWWRCAEHGPFSTSSIRRIRNNGFCPACKAKGTLKPVPFKKTSDMGVTTVPFYLAERHPELAAKWHPTLNGDVEFSLIPLWDERNRRPGRWWWQCGAHGPYQRKVSANTVPDMAPCPKCSMAHKNRGGSVSFDMSLAGKQPAVAAEWHPTLNGDVTPAMVTVASHTRRWWQYDIHGAFEMAPANRTRSAKPGRCPKCTKAKSATRAPYRTQ